MSTSATNLPSSQPANPAPKSSGLGVKDLITFSFSIVALVVSLLNFYFTNVRVDDDLQARVADTQLLSEPSVSAQESKEPGNTGKQSGQKSKESPKENKYVVARIAFINSGNRPAMVLGAKYQMSSTADRQQGAFGDDFQTSKETFPLLLEPRAMRLVDLRIPLTNLLGSLESGAPLTPSPWPDMTGKTVQFYTAIQFFSVDSRGQSYDVWSKPFAVIELHETGLAGTRQIAEKYSATSLFTVR